MDVFDIRLKRLRQLLADSGLERDAFCEQAGITYVQYGHYAGLNPSKRIGDIVARRVERNLNLPNGYMDSLNISTQSIQSDIVTNQNGYILTPLSFWDGVSSMSDDDVAISYFKEVELEAGDESTQVLEIRENSVRFSKCALQSAGVDVENAAGATASGDSMADKISDGAALVIDKSRTIVKDGKIYAIEHNGMFRIKYLHKLPSGGLRLRSHNKGYKDEDYTVDQVRDQIKILGWVFWWSTVDRW